MFIYLLVIFLNVMASGFLKKQSTFEDFTAGFIYAFLAMACYGLSFVMYAFLLKNNPLSKAYPIVTFGAYLGIVFVGKFFFHESFSKMDFFAYLLIGVGLFVLIANASK